MMDELHQAMLLAFSDYVVAMHSSALAFDIMMRQRSLSLPVSAVAVEDGVVVAFWLVGLRDEQAYLIASGTSPKHRRQGLSRRLARHVFDALARFNASSISLEVIAGNANAIALYDALGFAPRRRLDCYALPPFGAAAVEAVDLRDTPWSSVADAAPGFWNYVPSWQNDRAALTALEGEVRCVAASDGERLIGYAALLPASNTLAQFGVLKAARRRGVGSALLSAAAAQAHGELRIINLDARDEDTRLFISAMGGAKTIEQIEMGRRLSP